jgi:hypothetical protein
MSVLAEGVAPRPDRERTPWPLVLAAAITAVIAGGLGPWRPEAAVGLVIVVWGSYLVVCAPAIGVAGLALLTPVLSGMRAGLPVPHLRLSEVLIVWVGGLVILAARRPVPRWGPLEWAGLAYGLATLGLGLLDLARRHSSLGDAQLNQMVGAFQYLVLLRAVRVGCPDPQDVRRTLRALLAGAVPVSLLALLQGFGVTAAHRFAVTLTGVDEGHLTRAIGPFSNWQVLAGYLFIIALLTTAALVEHESIIVSAKLGIPLLVLVLAALARTLTIGAFVGAILGCGVLLVGAGRIRMSRAQAISAGLVAVGGLAAVVAARFQQQFTAQTGQAPTGLLPQTIADRVHNWTHQYLPALTGRWPIGYGPGLPPQATWRYTDSVYITVLLRGGLVLLGFYLLLMYAFYRQARTIDRSSVRHVPAVAVAVAVALLLVLQLIATYFTTSGLPEVLWMLAGLSADTSGLRPRLSGRADDARGHLVRSQVPV